MGPENKKMPAGTRGFARLKLAFTAVCVSVFLAFFGTTYAYLSDTASAKNSMRIADMYTVTFLDEGGSTVSSEKYFLGEEIVVPADEVKAEDSDHFTYTFWKWENLDAGKPDIETSTGSVKVTGNATYQATFAKDTVSWFVKGDKDSVQTTGVSENDAWVADVYAKTVANSGIPDGQLVIYPTNAGLQDARSIARFGTMESQASITSAPWYGYDTPSSIFVYDGCRTNVNAQGLFYNFPDMTGTVDCSRLDTSLCTDMSYMFAENWWASSIDVSGFDTSDVVNLSHMFEDCQTVKSLDVSSFTSNGSSTGSCVNFDNMFDNCYSVTEIKGHEDFDTSKTKSLRLVFSECKKMPALDLSKWETSQVEDFYGTFSGMHSLVLNDSIAKLDTSSAVNMSVMFQYCWSFVDVAFDLDTSNCEDMSGMFNYCENLVELDISSFDTRKVGNFNIVTRESGNLATVLMFSECHDLEVIHFGPNFTFAGSGSASVNNGLPGQLPEPDPACIPDADGKWYADSDGAVYEYNTIPAGEGTYRAYPPAYAAVYGTRDTTTADKVLVIGRAATNPPDTYEGLPRYQTFRGIETASYTSSTLPPWHASYASLIKKVAVVDHVRPASCAYWFYGLNVCEEYDLDALDTSNSTAFNHMFYGNNSLGTLDVSGFDTRLGTSFAGMFYNCISLATLDLSSFDTGNAENMNNMLAGMSGLGTFVVSEAFSFDGCGTLASGTSAAVLPAGNWVNAAGTTFAAADVPDDVADAYSKAVSYSLRMLRPAASADKPLEEGFEEELTEKDEAAGVGAGAGGADDGSDGVEAGADVEAEDVVEDAGGDDGVKPVEDEVEDENAFEGEVSDVIVSEEELAAYAFVLEGADEADARPMVFVRSPEAISVGDVYEGMEVLAVYAGIEDTEYWYAGDDDYCIPAWASTELGGDGNCRFVTSVAFADEISPVSVSFWFWDFSSCTSLDISGLSFAECDDAIGLFGEDMIALEELVLGDTLPVAFEKIAYLELPAPGVSVEGTDGLWHGLDGKSYLPADLPREWGAYYASASSAAPADGEQGEIPAAETAAAGSAVVGAVGVAEYLRRRKNGSLGPEVAPEKTERGLWL